MANPLLDNGRAYDSQGANPVGTEHLTPQQRRYNFPRDDYDVSPRLQIPSGSFPWKGTSP